ncbi:MAG: hypothetical protein COS68_04525 [Elusimicrobia bacterium CG06_land_8_20_14_3_00_38_11]|nr:MAG: hypothetical protein COS68_04525 [Elusimicrobia bacterium CG06_land_8_20_14_3_00_38_11]
MSKSFVRIITSRMKEKGIGVRQLARKCGIDASFISKVIQGKRNPPSDEKIIEKLASFLSVDPLMLTIYTGKIPSVMQPLLENESLVKQLLLKKPLVFEENRYKKKLSVSSSLRRPVVSNKTYQKSEITDELL